MRALVRNQETLMNKGYWIVRADIVKQEGFSEYVKRTPEALKIYGGKFLVRAGNHECVEGNTRSRNTLIEFPSYEAALKCWNSKEYQEAKSCRAGAVDIDIVIVEGFSES
jgi:uncharacterized protein (DUF1330 family)